MTTHHFNTEQQAIDYQRQIGNGLLYGYRYDDGIGWAVTDGYDEAVAFVKVNGGELSENNGVWIVTFQGNDSNVGGSIAVVAQYGVGFGVTKPAVQQTQDQLFSQKQLGYWDRVGRDLGNLPGQFTENIVKKPLDAASAGIGDAARNVGGGLGSGVGKALLLPAIVIGGFLLLLMFGLHKSGTSVQARGVKVGA